MPFTAAARQSILGHAVGTRAYTPPANYHIGLSSTQPSDTGTNITEPSGGGYARVSVANNSTNWSAPSAGAENEVSNATIINFGTASASWGAAVGFWFASSAGTGGTIHMWGPLASPQTVAADNPVSFAVGALTTRLRRAA
jgi:hypothetical protein